MTAPQATKACHLGFLTVTHQPVGYVGGYLVTNVWGRPIEFRLTAAVQPNRVQQILYGGTLQPYICADLIGKTLLEKTTAEAHLVVTDCEPALELRLLQEVPVAWVAGDRDAMANALAAAGTEVTGLPKCRLFCHPRFPQDVPAVQTILAGVDPSLDLSEPFARVREAITEARRLGVPTRG